MNKIRDLARNVLDDISVGNHIDIICEICDGVYIVTLKTSQNTAVFDIIDERLKMVSISSYQGFSEEFVKRFQNYMLDELYCY